MQTKILFIGKEFRINEAFVDYVKRQTLRHVNGINAITFVEENDKNLFLYISKAMEEYRNLLIVTTHQSYPATSKIVATLFEDNLVAKENFLVPSQAQKVVHNSFFIENNSHAINVVRVQIGNTFPPIFLHEQDESIFLYIFGLDEQQILQTLLPLAKSYDIELIVTQETLEIVKVFAYKKKFGDVAMFVQNAKSLLPQNLIVTDNLFDYIIERFSALHRTITFAESCTGGLLASMLTKIPGSSNIFHGSLVTYANEIKHAWLNVSNDTLQNFGAVSEETVTQMLRGARKVADADYAIAISGIAGPGGATPTKPVGTVVIGCSSNEKTLIRTMHFQGDRNYIQYQAAMYGIRLLFDLAKEELF